MGLHLQYTPEIGDSVKIVNARPYGFSFKNKAGGTGMSNWDHDQRYQGPTPVITLNDVFYDYETGYRCIGDAVNPELVEYLEKVAHPKDKRVFITEHNISPL